MKIQIGFRFLPVSPVVIGGRSGFLYFTQYKRARTSVPVLNLQWFSTLALTRKLLRIRDGRFFLGLQFAHTIEFCL